MVLGKLPVPGRPTIWITVGQGPSALVVGAGGGCSDIFTLIYPFFPLSPSLWEMARYRLKYCLKGPLNPKPTNQPTEETDLSRPPVELKTAKLSNITVSEDSYTRHFTKPNWRWWGGAMVLRKLRVSGCPSYLDDSRARALFPLVGWLFWA